MIQETLSAQCHLCGNNRDVWYLFGEAIIKTLEKFYPNCIVGKPEFNFNLLPDEPPLMKISAKVKCNNRTELEAMDMKLQWIAVVFEEKLWNELPDRYK